MATLTLAYRLFDANAEVTIVETRSFDLGEAFEVWEQHSPWKAAIINRVNFLASWANKHCEARIVGGPLHVLLAWPGVFYANPEKVT